MSRERPVLRVYVDDDLRLVVEGADAGARVIAFAAADAARGEDGRFTLEADGADSWKVRLRVVFRATPEQLRRIVAEWMEAAIGALRGAAYEVTGRG